MTCCTTEMQRTEANYPKYGTILAVVKSFKRNEELYKIDSSLDLENTKQVYEDYYGTTIANQKLVLELSVMFNPPRLDLSPYFNKLNNYGWDSMKHYLYSGELWAGNLKPGDSISLTTSFTPIPLNRNRGDKGDKGVRLNKSKAGTELSFVIKQFARNMSDVEPYIPHMNLYKKDRLQRKSPLEAFSVLTGGTIDLLSDSKVS
jgi:hypothetical protein